LARRLRVFISSPGDVPDERLRAGLIIDRLAQDYRRFFAIEAYRWEHEPMLASGHFQDAIDPPSKFDIVILILWSRLGTALPETYRGLDGRAPVTGTEWEYEEALKAARAQGAPDILAFRNARPALIDALDLEARNKSLAQLDALDAFWRRHFADRGTFLTAFSEYRGLDEFAARLEESLRKLIERRVQTAVVGDADAPIWLDAPFRGLHPYEFEHAAIFFGRGGLVARAAEQLALGARNGTAFLLVSGPSGSGKSSVVKAALVPALIKPQRIEGAAFLRRAIYRPGDAGGDIVLGLVEALTHSAGGALGLPELLAPGQDASQLAAHLRSAVEAPGFVFASALGHLTRDGRASGRLLAFEEAKLILIVDQLEELFTASSISPDDRKLFVRLLAGLARSGAVWVIATLRADFWHRVAEYPELMALAEGPGRLDVAPPSQAEIGEMIRKPAQAAGLSFESHPKTGIALDAMLAEDAVSEAGVLPLLSFTLDALYAQDVVAAGGRVLTYATYEKLGELEGAIATRAEEVVAKLSDPARAEVPRVLRSLATVSGGVDQAPVARVAPLSAFPEGTAARAAVDAFTAARLMVASSEGATPTVRFAHEALMSRWQRAREQLATDRRDLETRALVERQMTRWSSLESGRNRLLLRDPDLANAIDIERRWGDELEPDVREYIAESKRYDLRRQRISQAVAASFALLFVVSVVALYFADQERGRAAAARNVAQTEQQHAVEAAAREKIAAERAEDGQRALSVTISERLVRPAAEAGRTAEAIRTALSLLPTDVARPNRQLVPDAVTALAYSISQDRQIAVFGKSDKPIWDVAFSPDGKLMATGSVDKTVRVYDVEHQTLMWTRAGHEDVVTDVVFTHDGKRLISTGGKDVIAWDVATGAKLGTFVGHQRVVSHVLLFPDDQRFATSSWDNTVRIWRLDRTEPLLTITAPDVSDLGSKDPIMKAILGVDLRLFGSMENMALSPDGKRLVAGGRTAPVAWVFDTDTGAVLTTLSGHRPQLGNQFSQVAFDSDGDRIATASGDGTARLWDATTGEQLAVLGESASPVDVVAFSPNGDRVVTGGGDGVGRLWDRTGHGIAVLSGHKSGINSIDVSRDGRTIVTGAQDGSARLWDAQTGRPLGILAEQAGILAVRFSPDGHIVATAGRDNTVRLWQAQTAGPYRRFDRPDDDLHFGRDRDPTAMVFAPNRQAAISIGNGEQSTLVDLVRGQRVASLEGSSPRFSRDGRRVLMLSPSVARLYDTASGKQMAAVSASTAVMSPAGNMIAVQNGNVVSLYETDHGVFVANLAAQGSPPSILRFDDTGKTLFTASNEGAWIWDARTGSQVAKLALTQPVKSMVVDPAGSRLLTTDVDNKMALWRVADGRRIGGEPAPEILKAGFSADGKRFVTTSDDASATVWDAVSGAKVATLPARDTDKGEWKPLAPVCDSSEDLVRDDEVLEQTCTPFGPDGSWLLLQQGGLWRPGIGIERVSLGDLSNRASLAGQADGGNYVMTSKGKLLIIDVAKGRAVTLGAPNDRIKSYRVYSDLDRVVTVSAAGIAKIWHSKDGTEVATLVHPGSVIQPDPTLTKFAYEQGNCVAISPDSAAHQAIAIVTRSDDGRARLWNGDGALLAEMTVPETPTLNFAYNDCRLVAQTRDGVRIIETITGHEIANLKLTNGSVESVQSDVAPGVLLVKTKAGDIDLYRESDGHALAHFALEKSGEMDFSQHFSVAGNWLLAATKNHEILLVDLAQGSSRVVSGLSPHGDFLLNQMNDPRLVLSDSNGAVWWIDAASGKIVAQTNDVLGDANSVNGATLNRYAETASSSPLSPRSNVRVLGPDRVILWKGGQKSTLFDATGRRIAELDAALLDPDVDLLATTHGDRLVMRSADGKVCLWNATNGASIALPAAMEPSRQISLVHDDDNKVEFLSIGDSGSLVQIDALSGHVVPSEPQADFADMPLTSGDKHYVAAFSSDGNAVELKDTANGKVLFSAPVDPDDGSLIVSAFSSVFSVAAPSNDRKLLLIRGSDWSLWRLNPLRRNALGPTSETSRIVLGDDRALIIRNSGAIELWRIGDGTKLNELRRPKGPAGPRLGFQEEGLDVRFVDDGRHVVVLADGKVTLFDGVTGSPLGPVGLARDTVVKVSSSTRGSFIQTVSAAGAVRVVRVDGKSSVLTLKEAAPRAATSTFFSADRVMRPVFDAEGKRLIVGDNLTDLQVLDTDKGVQLVSGIRAIDPDASRIILKSASDDADGQSLDVVDVSTGNVSAKILLGAQSREDGFMRSFAPARLSARVGDRLFSVEADHTISVWDLAAGRLDSDALIKLPAAATAMVASPDSTLLVIGMVDGTVLVRHLASTEPDVNLGRRSRAVNRLAFDPTGAVLLVGSSDGNIELFDLKAARSIAVLPLNIRGPDSPHAFSPDGQRLAIVAADAVVLLDPKTGAAVTRIPIENRDHSLGLLRFAPDSATLMLYNSSRDAQFVDGRTGAPILRLPGSTTLDSFTLEKNFDPAFSPDGRRVLVRVDARHVAVWELSSAKQLFDIGGTSDLAQMSFSPDGRTILTVYQGGVLRVSRASDGGTITEVSDLGSVAEASLGPDGKRIFLRGKSGTRARLVAADTGAEVAQLSLDGTPDFSRFSADSRYLATHASDGQLRVFDAADGHQTSALALDYFINDEWQLFSTMAGPRLLEHGNVIKLFSGETGKELAGLQIQNNPVQASRYEGVLTSNKASRVLVAGNNEPRLFDGISGAQIAVLGGQSEFVTRATLSRDGSRVTTWSADGMARLWDAENGRLINSYGAADQPVVGGQLSATGNTLVLLIRTDPKQDSKLVVFNGKDGSPAGELGTTNDRVKLDISPDEATVVASGQNSGVEWWSLPDHRRLGRYEGATAAVFSNDGRYLAVSLDGRVALADSHAPARPHYLEGHSGKAITAAFALRGQTLVTAGADGLRVWDVATATLLRVIPKTDHPILTLGLSQDGASTATLDDQGAVEIWKNSPEQFALSAPVQSLIDFAEIMVPAQPPVSQSEAIGTAGEGQNDFANWVGMLADTSRPSCAAGSRIAGPTAADDSAEAELTACEKAVAVHPADADLQNLLGMALEATQHSEQAVATYRKAAEAHNGHAADRLGNMYLNGEAGLQKSVSDAAIWFRQAADAGVADAAAQLALMNVHDAHTSQEHDAAMARVVVSANQGSSLAHAFLAQQALSRSSPDWADALFHWIVAYRLSGMNRDKWPLENGIAAAARKLGAAAALPVTAKARAWSVAESGKSTH
jgi:WD40 repeat protein